MNGFVIGTTGQTVVCIYQRRQNLFAVRALASVDINRLAKQKATLGSLFVFCRMTFVI
jgi:hypothetical protein